MAARDLVRAARGLAALALAMAVAACATVPDAQERQARKQQAGQSADTGWSSYERGRDIVARASASDTRDARTRHQAIEAAISGAPLVHGNDVRLLTDGAATYRAMLESIGQARHYVHMETYIFEDDEEGRRFADALIAAHRRGAAVAVMIDAVGTLGTADTLFDRMREAGVQIAVFNPVNPAAARAGWSPTSAITASCWWWTARSGIWAASTSAACIRRVRGRPATAATGSPGAIRTYASRGRRWPSSSA